MLHHAMRTALQCLAKAIEMDAKAVVFDTEHHSDYAELAENWRYLACESACNIDPVRG